MKRRKPTIWLFLLGLLLLPGKIMAQDAIKVVEPDGHEIFYSLSSHPKVTFVEKAIRLTSDRLEVTYELYDVHKVEFVDLSGVDEITGDATVFNITPETIEVNGLDANVAVTLFDTAGKLMLTESADDNGNTIFSISTLPQGVYVVNAGKTTFKFYKK